MRKLNEIICWLNILNELRKQNTLWFYTKISLITHKAFYKNKINLSNTTLFSLRKKSVYHKLSHLWPHINREGSITVTVFHELTFWHRLYGLYIEIRNIPLMIYICWTAAISSSLGTLAAAWIHSRPLCGLYHVRPSCILMPQTKYEAQGWCIVLYEFFGLKFYNFVTYYTL